MINFTDDPVRDAERYQEEYDRASAFNPVCCCCGEPIMDEYLYDMNSDLYCEACFDDYLEGLKAAFRADPSKYIDERYI